MKPVQLKDHEVIMIFQALESIWWDNNDMKAMERLQAKLRRQAKNNPQLTAWLDKNWPV